MNVLVCAVTDIILLLAMIIGVIRLESDSSIWRMLYRHVCHPCAMAHCDIFPEHIFCAGYGLDCTGHHRTSSANGESHLQSR